MEDSSSAVLDFECGIQIFLIQDARMVSAIELKRRVTGACILGIVISKLSHRKKLFPVILFKVDKGSKVNFYCTISSLGLAVCLKMESSEKPLLDAKEIALSSS